MVCNLLRAVDPSSLGESHVYNCFMSTFYQESNRMYRSYKTMVLVNFYDKPDSTGTKARICFNSLFGLS